MPKRNDLQSILILGAGPIVIGQACEFDYSGAQACKALREEGYRVILVNSNPATIMTDPEMADATYIEPITWEVVREIIKKERPDAILPTMGGQTALNCALALEQHGVLKEFGVEMIGATADAIDKARHFKAKNIGQLVEGHIRIFHHIMEEGGSKGCIIHMKLGQDACYPQRMDDVGFTAGPFLAGMLLRRKIIGLPDELHLARGQVFPDSHIKFLCTDWCGI